MKKREKTLYEIADEVIREDIDLIRTLAKM